MDKIQIIKEIVKHHPGYGTDKGWSWYVGGMKDDGDWKWDILVDQSDYDLQKFLDYLLDCDKKVKANFEERERIAALPEEERNAIYKKEQEEQKRLIKEWVERQERFLMWGK